MTKLLVTGKTRKYFYLNFHKCAHLCKNQRITAFCVVNVLKYRYQRKQFCVKQKEKSHFKRNESARYRQDTKTKWLEDGII